MAYTGKRKPKDNDIEKWKLFFNLNPDRIKEFENEYNKITDAEEVEEVKEVATTDLYLQVPTKTKLTTKEKNALLGLLNQVFWSPLIGGAITVTRVDPERNLLNVRIVKSAVMSLEEFLSLPVEFFGGQINNDSGLKAMYEKQSKGWDTEAIKAFKEFRASIGNEKRTPLEKWFRENIKE